MEIVKITNKIWHYKNIDLDVENILYKINNDPEYDSWSDYTNGYLLDGSEFESSVKGRAIYITPDADIYNPILNVMIDCINNYLLSNGENIDIGNLDINPIDSNGNKRSTQIMIRKYLAGTTMSPHWDAILNNGGGYTVLLYFNDNYEGGELKFNQENIVLKPSPASVLIFPELTEHEILYLKSGERYMTAAYIFKNYPSYEVSV